MSLHKVPVTTVAKARHPVIDMHAHSRYAKTPEDVDLWVKVMDAVGIQKTVLLTGAYGEEFDRIAELYSRYPDRFELWCGFDYTGHDQPGFGPAAVAELDRCFRKGAKGVGEEGDKGLGMGFGRVKGLHFDDSRMAPLLDRCGELGIPVSVHVADPIWMYQKMDETNDGMMNAVKWRLDDKPGIVDHAGMIDVLERAVRRHPRTTFIAVHFANLDYDLARLGPAPRSSPQPLRRHLGPLRGDGRDPPLRGAVHHPLPGPPRLRHRHGPGPGDVPPDLPHPGDARRALLLAAFLSTTGATRASGSRDKVLKKLYQANARQIAKKAAADARPAAAR